MNNTLQHVVRFYGNTDYALECIALKQITFIHVDKLNDPFDPVLDFVTDFNDDYQSLLNYVVKNHSAQLEAFKERLPRENWSDILDSLSKLAEKNRSNLFLFSTCAVNVEVEKHPRDNLYMWGHYGNGHRGVAIEFNTTILTELLKKLYSQGGEVEWWKMEYQKEVPKISCESIFELMMNRKKDSDDLESCAPKLVEILNKRSCSKGDIWENEEEYRLVQRNDETKLKIWRCGIPNDAISAVYLGCEMKDEQVQKDFTYEIKRQFPKASVFQVKQRKGEFALDFDKIFP